MVADELDLMQGAYAEWKETVQLTEANPGMRKVGGKDTVLGCVLADGSPATLTTIMQRVLAWPIESKSPLESMAFLADVKHQIAALV